MQRSRSESEHSSRSSLSTLLRGRLSFFSELSLSGLQNLSRVQLLSSVWLVGRSCTRLGIRQHRGRSLRKNDRRRCSKVWNKYRHCRIRTAFPIVVREGHQTMRKCVHGADSVEADECLEEREWAEGASEALGHRDCSGSGSWADRSVTPSRGEAPPTSRGLASRVWSCKGTSDPSNLQERPTHLFGVRHGVHLQVRGMLRNLVSWLIETVSAESLSDPPWMIGPFY